MNNPVFNDASGGRAVAVQWMARIFLVVVILAGLALALTLGAHVTVPGLNRTLPGLGDGLLRPAVPPAPNRPLEPEVLVDRAEFRPLPSTEPTPRRAGGPTDKAAATAPTRHATERSRTTATAAPTLERSSPSRTQPPATRPSTTAPPSKTAPPRRTAGPTAKAPGPGPVKTRNPNAAMPRPQSQQPPGQNQRPTAGPTADLPDADPRE